MTKMWQEPSKKIKRKFIYMKRCRTCNKLKKTKFKNMRKCNKCRKESKPLSIIKMRKGQERSYDARTIFKKFARIRQKANKNTFNMDYA